MIEERRLPFVSAVAMKAFAAIGLGKLLTMDIDVTLRALMRRNGKIKLHKSR